MRKRSYDKRPIKKAFIEFTIKPAKGVIKSRCIGGFLHLVDIQKSTRLKYDTYDFSDRNKIINYALENLKIREHLSKSDSMYSELYNLNKAQLLDPDISISIKNKIIIEYPFLKELAESSGQNLFFWIDGNVYPCPTIGPEYTLIDGEIEIPKCIDVINNIKHLQQEINSILRDPHSYDVHPDLTKYKSILAKLINSEDTQFFEIEYNYLNYEEKIRIESVLSNINTQSDILESILPKLKNEVAKAFRENGFFEVYKNILSLEISSEKQIKGYKKEQKKDEIKSKLAMNEKEKRRIIKTKKKTLENLGYCSYCEKVFDDNIITHVDHIYPLSRGGLEVDTNLIIVCSDCNIKKSNMTLREFIKKFGLNKEKIELRLERLKKVF